MQSPAAGGSASLLHSPTLPAQQRMWSACRYCCQWERPQRRSFSAMPPSSCATARCVGAGAAEPRRLYQQPACHATATAHGMQNQHAREALRPAFKQLQPESTVLGPSRRLMAGAALHTAKGVTPWPHRQHKTSSAAGGIDAVMDASTAPHRTTPHRRLGRWS